VSSPLPPDTKPSSMAGVDLADQLAVLQAELAAIKTETAVKAASLEDTIANLAHENTLLKRRLYGNRTERSHTSEMQLALGDLLKDSEDGVRLVGCYAHLRRYMFDYPGGVSRSNVSCSVQRG
jgi:hypothetical protein